MIRFAHNLRFFNLFWGMQFRIHKNFRAFANHQFSLTLENFYKYKSHTAITSIVIRLANQLRIKCESIIFRHCEANHRFAEAIQKIAQPNLARFVVQKIGFKGRSSASADFLLESDKRGSPPKSEKVAAFWRVGGAGRGVQPFLREKTSESESEKIVGDSNVAKIDCHDSAFAESRNDGTIAFESFRNAQKSSQRTHLAF